MSQAFNRATSWIVDRPSASLFLLIVISVIAGIGYKDPSILTRYIRPQSDDSEQTSVVDSLVDVPNVQRFDITNAHAVLLIESDNSFFTPLGAKALREIDSALESLDYVSRIVWMDDVPELNIFGLPEPLLPRAESAPERFAVAREKARKHPFVNGQLLSSDGKTLLMLVYFDYFFLTEDDDVSTNLVNVATEAASRYAKNDFEFSVTGRTPIYLEIVRANERNQLFYQSIAYATIGLMSIILFRGVTAILVVSFAPALGVFWTMGILRYFDFQDNPFNDVIVPVLLSLVGFTDGVHLMVQIRKLRSSGMAPRDAARAGIREVGLACALTSLTTAIGFGSLALSSHELVIEFGWCCVIGVILTFFAVVTSIPLACSTWLGKRIHVGHSKGFIDIHLQRISGIVDFVLKRLRLFSGLGIATTIILAGVSCMLRPDQRQTTALPESSEAARALTKMDRALGGLEVGYVNVRWSETVEPESPEILSVLTKINDILQSQPLIGHPLSIKHLLDTLPGDTTSMDRMPMLELLPPSLKRSFYTPERKSAQVMFRVQDIGIAKYGPVFEEIRDSFDELTIQHPDFTFTLSGRPIDRYENLYQIVVDLTKSLGAASVIIFCVLTVVYRSLRIGLISLIPNLFPLAVAGTYLYATGQSLEIVSVCAFTVCLGIAVDDTIHFLTRYVEESKRTDDRNLAIRDAFTGVGTALIMTTIVLVTGFLTVLSSDSREHRIFAAMGAITIASALFGDLIFLPALLSKYGRSKPKNK